MHRERRLVYTQSEAEVQSPKRTVNTHISPAERKAYESQYIPGSQSDVEAYGQNFGEYVISDPNDAGLISGRRDFQTYGSSVEQQQQRRDLASSAATYRSNQVITSSQAIRVEGGGTSGNTIGISGNTIGISGGNGVGGSYSGGSTGYVSTTGGYTSTTGGIKTIGGGISGGNGGNVVIETTRRVYEEGGSSGSSGSPTIGLRSGYGQGAVNLSGDNNQLMVGGSGSGNSSYGGGGVKITTSRITSGGDNSGSMRQVQQTEATYSSTTREGVPTTTRKYQFHERKYEKE